MGDEIKINLAIDKVKLLHEASDSQLAVAEVWVCRSGQNSHRLPITLEAIKGAEYTLINKFLVAGFDENTKDFKGHEGLKQRIVGFFPKENDIRYEEDENGETYLVANAIISKFYCPWAYDAFVSKNFREVSMEILVAETEDRDDGYQWITSFIINGVTVLGLNRRASIQGSHIEVTEFEDLIKKGEKFYQEFASGDTESIDMKNIEKEECILMDFNKEEFAKVSGITSEAFKEMLNEACSVEKFGDFSKYYVRDYDAEYVFAYSRETDGIIALKYSFADEKVSVDLENPKNCHIGYVIVDDENMDTLGFAEMVKEVVDAKEKVFEDEKEVLTKDLEEVNAKFSTLEEEKNTLGKEFEDLKVEFEQVKKGNDELLKFKSNVEETEKNNKIEFAIQEVMDDLTSDQINEWRDKVVEYESADDFANAIQSFAYSVSKNNRKKNKDGVHRISLPNTSKEKDTSKSIWDKLKK